ncbi:hypothetical protein [Actinospica robiniae]|uniref:hypothetical protein n=1 Tax=Actinospica robiniae TaxID=304901 RepID=UPI0004205C5A|nr:hypothetical protein [Actinospica robiniae]
MKADLLCRRVFTALREGRLEADPVVELACELLDWGHYGSAVREVVERVPAGLAAGELAGLAARLLDEAAFEPGFDLVPERLDVLREALRVVARDLAAGGIEGEPRLELVEEFGPAMPRILLADGRWIAGGPELCGPVGDDLTCAVATMADVVQCGLMEQTWQVWPVCAEHPRLGAHAVVRSGEAVWWCVGGVGHVVGAVGELGARRRSGRR